MLTLSYLYMLKWSVFFITNVKKSKKIDKNSYNWRRKTSDLLNNLMNFNELSGNNVTKKIT